MNELKVKSRKSKVIIIFASLFFLNGNLFALTLQEAMEIAMKNSPAVTAAKEGVGVASAQMGQAGSMLLPTVSMSASKGNNYTQPYSIVLPPSMGGGTMALYPDMASQIESYSFTLNQNVFTGGRILQGISAARVGYDSAVENLKKAKLELEYNLASAYYGVLEAKKNLEITESTISRMEKQVKQSEYNYSAGLSSKSDFLMAQTQMANMQVMQIAAKGSLDLSILSLQTVMGQKGVSGEAVSDAEISDAPAGLDRNSVLAAAFKYKPDWRSFELAIKTANDAVVYSYGGYLPSFMYQYSTGRSKSEYGSGNPLNTDLGNWRSMLVGSWNLFDGFNTPNKIREAYASLNQAKAQEKSIRDAVELEVDSSIMGVDTARQTLAASMIAEDIAKRSYEYAEVGYKAGIVSGLNYLDAQIAYSRAQSSLWSAKYDLEIAKAKLNKAVGVKIL